MWSWCDFLIRQAVLPNGPPCRPGQRQRGATRRRYVRRLSNAFYQRVWAEPENSPFRTFFVNHVESPTVAADAQWRWLVEIWGGAKRYSERFGDDTLINKMLSKHSAARMSYQNCRRWLQLMLAAMDEVGLGGEVSIRRYWLHFFGFFELTLAQRRELRALALPGAMAEL